MNRTTRLLCLAIAMGLCARAENRALLIGIRNYPNYPGLRSLEGPVNDAEKLAEALEKNWGFPHANIRLLRDQEATRKGILDALDLLVSQTKPGDKVLVYYSGHGTSFHDTNTQGFGMDMRTGAIIPQDLAAGKPAQVLGQLIVGTRDLRPRFTKIDQKAQLIILFDSCYSGDAAKSVPKLISRDADLFARSTPEIQKDFDDRLDALMTQNQAPTADEWPYKQAIYISAAARHEQAWDIPAGVLKNNHSLTIDGLPHGTFTNGILAGLAGAADLDHDGKITYRELHNYLLQSVQTRHGQTPQLFPKGIDNKLTNDPLFGALQAQLVPDASRGDTVLAVKVEASAPKLLAGLKANPHIRLTDGTYQVRVIRESPGLAIEHASGGRIFSGSLNETEALDLLNRLGEAQQVVGVRYPKQDFNVTLTVEKLGEKGPEVAGSFQGGDHVRLRMAPEKPAYLVLLDVDVEGRITMIYPLKKEDLRPIRAGETLEAAESEVSAPFGTEVLKMFAFRDKPEGYDDLVAAPEIKGAAIRKFQKMIAGDGVGKSQTMQITFSQPRS